MAMIPVIELIRVSTEAQAGDDRASIPAQRTVNRTTAGRFGLNIVETIELTDVSGASVLMAPEMQRLLELIQSPAIAGVVAREFSRLMRPEKFSDYALLQAFADSHTKLFLPEGPLDFSDKSGRLMGTIRAAIAGLERSEIRERCWRGKEEKRKAGKKVSSTVPTGVGYDRHRGWFYTEDSTRVKRAFEMVLSGVTQYSAIAQRTGLSEGSLCKLLRNPIWTGWRVYDQRVDSGQRVCREDGRQGYSVKVPRAPEDIIRVRVIDEPLVSDSDFEEVARILDMKRQVHRREKSHGTCIYNGFVFCAYCGGSMFPVVNKSRRYYYICRSRKHPHKYGPPCEQGYVRSEDLDRTADVRLTEILRNTDFLTQIAFRLGNGKEAAAVAEKLTRIECEMRGMVAKKRRITEGFIDGVIPKNMRDERLAAVDRQLLQLEAEMEFLKARGNLDCTADGLALYIEPLLDVSLLGRKDRRRLLTLMNAKIHVRGARTAEITTGTEGTNHRFTGE